MQPARRWVPLLAAPLLAALVLASPHVAVPGEQPVRGYLLDPQDSQPPPEAQPAGIPANYVELVLRDCRFEPSEMSLPAGTDVRIVNAGASTRGVTGLRVAGVASAGLAPDGPLAPGQALVWAALGPGAYEVGCAADAAPDAAAARARITVT